MHPSGTIALRFLSRGRSMLRPYYNIEPGTHVSESSSVRPYPNN